MDALINLKPIMISICHYNKEEKVSQSIPNQPSNGSATAA
jgi:hypothetical protein